MPRLARLAFCFVTCLLASTSFAQQPAVSSVPNLIRYSGTLQDTQAMTVSSAPVGVTFAIYKQQDGGAPIWQETQNVTPDVNGQYTVLLGTTTAAGLPDDLFSQQEQRWLGIQLQGEAEQPRVLMVSVPYAFKAHDAETLGGLPASAFVKAPPSDGTSTGNTYVNTTSSTTQNAASTGNSTSTGKSGTGIDTVINCTTAKNNYIPVFTGVAPPNITICNSVMYQANGNIGIGTTTPAALLSVINTIAGNPAAILGSSSVATSTGVVGGNTAATGNPIGVQGTVTAAGGAGVEGTNNSANGMGPGVLGMGPMVGVAGNAMGASGQTTGVMGTATSPSGVGVYGVEDATTGDAVGVSGISSSTSGIGVTGAASATSGSTTGVSGLSSSTAGIGVFGAVSATTGETIGVKGATSSTSGVGVSGVATATSGSTNGVYGETDSSSGYGVYGTATATSGTTSGVAGQTDSTGVNASGVFGAATTTSGNTNGVYGVTNSKNGNGVYGVATSTDTSGVAYGVYGESSNGTGILGVSTATSGSEFGVEGTTTTPNGAGVYGLVNLPNGNAVLGHNQATTGPAVGVAGESDGASGIGVLGAGGAGGAGVYGVAGSGAGSTAGLFLNSGGGYILVGVAQVNGNPKFSVQGDGSGFFAGALQVNGAGTFNSAVQINGNLNVGGTLTKGGGSFKIDDPLDPANKYLSHSFVESPDMMNIYNGTARLNARGEVWVTMPDYFDALNRDCQYVLTAIGRPQPYLYIARKMSRNRFKIAGGKPNAEVSWQVTGVRQDAWANAHRIPVEEDKPLKERGTYLHPELFGADTGRSVSARLSQPQTMQQK